MSRTKNRWARAAVGTILMLFLGSMYAWSYFKVALGAVYPGWSETQVSMNFTIMMSCFCLGGFFAGSWLNRLSKPRQLLLAAVLVTAGFLGTSFLPAAERPALYLLYLCYGVLTGLGTGVAYNAVLSGIQPWFPDNPGVISGLLLMGMGLGALILGNVAAKLIEATSIFLTFRLFAGAMLLVLLVSTLFVRAPGEGDVLPPPKVKKSAVPPAAGKDYTTAQMLRRPTFWVYFLWNICMSAGGMLVINSASSISIYYSLAAVIGLIVSVFNGLGRLAIGFCMDRIGWKGTMYLNNAILLLAGFVLCAGDKLGSGIVVLVGMLLMGVCYGGGITISAALIRQLYGSAHYAANFSVANLCLIPASIIGPIISAALVDASGGGYWTTFVMVVVLGVATMVMNLFIRKP